VNGWALVNECRGEGMLDGTDQNADITLEIFLRKNANGWELVNKCRRKGMFRQNRSERRDCPQNFAE
jgi:hypothetical protein